MEEAINNMEDSEEKRESIEKRVFKSYNSILNENIIGEKIYIFLLMLQSIQIMISPIQTILDSSNSDVNTVVDIIKLFNYAEYIISLNSLASYLVVMGTQIGILLFVIICLAIMIKTADHSITDNSHNNSWRAILQTISTALTLLSTIFFIPSLQLFLTTILCQQNGMSNIQCWSMSHLGIMLLGMFGLCLHLCLTYSLTLFFVEDYLFSNIPWAGNNKSTSVLIFFGMLLCAIFSAFRSHISHEIGGYGVVVLMLLFVITIYYKYEYSISYNKRVQIGYFWQSGVVIAIIFGLLPTQYLDITYRYSTFGVSFLLGGTLAYALSCMYELKMKDLLFMSEKEIRTKKRMNEYLVHLTPLLDNLHMHRWNRYLLHGIRNNHHQFCQNILCPCQNSHNFIFNPNYRVIEEYREVALQFTELERIMDKAKISQAASPLQLWIAHIQANWYQFIESYIQGLIRWQPRDIYLRLIDAYYKEYYLKNNYKSYYSLLQATNLTSNIRQRFLIYRLTTILDKNIKEEERRLTGNRVDLAGFVAFHEKNKRFQINLQTCTRCIKDFWANFISDHLRVKSLFQLSCKISNLLGCIKVGYMELTTLKPTYIRSYSLYGNFLGMVLHNESDAQQIIEKGEMMTRNSAIFAHSNRENASYDINAKAMVIRVKGSLDRLGDVISVNEWAFEISGHTPDQLAIANIRTIVPPFLAANHDEYMLRFIRTGKRNVIGAERLVFIYTKVGYYDPVMITMKTMGGLENGLEFVAFIHKNQDIIRRQLNLPYLYSRLNPKINFISVTVNGIIVGLSRRCAKVFGIPHNYFVRKNSLSSDVVPLTVLNLKMLTSEMDSQLLHGLVIELNTEALLKYIDRDYILEEEVEEMLQNMGILEVYIRLIFVTFSDGTTFKSYNFIVLKKVKDIQGRSAELLDIRGEMKNNNKSRASQDKQLLPENAASVANSSVTSVELAVNTMKRNLVKLQKPALIKLFEIILLIFGGFTIAALLGAYIVSNWDLLVYFDFFDSMMVRSVYFSQIINNFYIMLAALNYNLPNTEYTNDISAYANQQLYKKVDQLSKVEFDITKILHGELIPEDKKKNFVEEVDTKLLNPDFTYTIHHQDLGITIIQILTEIISLKESHKNNLLKTNALEHNFDLYNSGEKVLNQGNRTPTFEEIQIFSILYNGADPHALEELHEIAESAAQIMFDFLTQLSKIFYIFGIIFPIVLLVLIIFTIIMYIKIQEGKKDILHIFAEISEVLVNEMIEYCQKYETEELEYQKEKLLNSKEGNHKVSKGKKEPMRRGSSKEILGHEQNIEEKTPRMHDSDSYSDNDENKQLLGEDIAAQKAILFRDFHSNSDSESEEEKIEFLDMQGKSEEMNKSEDSDEYDFKDDSKVFLCKKEDILVNKSSKSSEEGNIKEVKSERESKNKEEAEKMEKKKRISNYSWGIDGITLLIVLLIGVIGTLKGVSNYLQMVEVNKNGDMIEHLDDEYDLILGLSYTLTFVLTFQQQMVPLPLLEGEDPTYHFYKYYDKSILEMEDVVHSKFKSSKLVDTLKSTLQKLFTPTYCDYVQSIIDISPAQCRTICSQTNSEGLKNAFHYTSYSLWQKYLNAQELVIRTEEWRVALRSTDLVELYLNIETIIIPTVEDIIKDSYREIKNILETQQRIRFILLIIEIIVYISLLIIIEIFFVKTQQKEIFMFKGILNLIPLDIIRKDPKTKEQIYKHAKIFM